MTRTALAAITTLLLLAGAVAAPVAGAVAAPTGGSPEHRVPSPAATPAPAFAGPTAATNAPAFSSTHFVVTVHPNGSATWAFQYRTELSNDTQKRRFREYASEFEHNDTALYDGFRSNARSLVADGRNATGRPMNATNFSRRAYTRGLNGNLGVVQMSFTWTGFARQRGERLVVGDLFQGGLYLGSQQWFVVHADPPLRFRSVSPAPNRTDQPTLANSNTVTWIGAREFTDKHPRLVLVPNATAAGGGAGPTTATPSGPTATSGSSSGLSWVPLVVVILVLLVAAGAAYWYVTRPGDANAETAADAGEDTGAGGADAGGGDAGGDGTEVTEAAPEPAVTDEEMLPDDERVRRLLRENGGRMRQVSIVEETDWSKSKVSMLLSEMEEAGDISRLRVGRENVVSLPGHEPAGTGGADGDGDGDE